MIKIIIIYFLILPLNFNRVLLWETIFLILLLITGWSFFFSTKNIFTLLIHSEFLILVIFFFMLLVALFFNINTLFGLAYIMLILGGLELALNIIILLL